MPKRVRAPLPIDLLNLVGSFVGDDYHYLTFKLTPKGFFSHHRFFMQSRYNPSKKTNMFLYTKDSKDDRYGINYILRHPLGAGILLVWYNFHSRRQECVRERGEVECDTDRMWELMQKRFLKQGFCLPIK